MTFTIPFNDTILVLLLSSGQVYCRLFKAQQLNINTKNHVSHYHSLRSASTNIQSILLYKTKTMNTVNYSNKKKKLVA